MGSQVANRLETTFDRILVIDREWKLVFKGQGEVSSHLNQATTSIQTALNGKTTSLFTIK
ncbi:MAG: hypothetical protein PF541_11065 [Prolixibacteraceae bacterium]|jgi:hypothetical protein|nr:hypothetical protein [Prolixibacteraceae bacterium]